METLNDYQSIWFAWYPVKTESGQWVWLENVGRILDINVDCYLGYTKEKYKYYKL
jgi:hypothetical protein